MKYKIVIIDDQPIVREALVKSMDWLSLNCEVVGTAGDGEEGIALIEETLPNLIITDIQMPGMDGLDMCRLVKKLVPNAKIIIMTGYQQFEYAQAAIRIGAFDFLIKPIKNSELMEITRAAVYAIEKERVISRSLPEARKKWLSDAIRGDEGSLHTLENAWTDFNWAKRPYMLLIGKALSRSKDLEMPTFKLEEAFHQAMFVLKRQYDFEWLDTKLESYYVCLFFLNMDLPMQDDIDFFSHAIETEIKQNWNGLFQLSYSEIQYDLRLLHPVYIETEKAARNLSKNGISHQVKNILEYISEKYSEDIGLEILSKAFDLSPAYISRLLKKETGENFVDLLSKTRIDASITLLKNSTYNINEVARLVGYKEYNYFYQVFKKYMGASPLEFRNQ